MSNREERRRLGSFGKKKKPVDASFEYFGHDIRVHPKLTNLILLGFMDVAETIDEADEMQSMKLVRDFLRSAIHPDDWELFWKTSIDEMQSLEDFMEIQWQIMEKCSDRPFTPSSDSPGGPDSTSMRSREDSFSRVMERLDDPEHPRPDLRSIVMEAHQKQVEAASSN